VIISTSSKASSLGLPLAKSIVHPVDPGNTSTLVEKIDVKIV